MKKKEKKLFLLWFSTFLANVLLIYLASITFSSNLVLGNASISGFLALLINALILTLVLTLVLPFTKALKLHVKSDASMSLLYMITNIFCLWILARAANYTGLGITSYFIAIVLGIALSIVQGLLWKTLDKTK